MFNIARWGNDLHDGRRSLPVVARSKLWLAIAAVLVVFSILLVLIKGINAGIEFRGGSQLTASGVADTSEQPAHDAVAEVAPAQQARVAVVGATTVRVQTQALTNAETEELRQVLADAYDVDASEVTATFIGPAWGQDITRQAVQGLIIFLVLVSVVLAVYFRNWQMALAALLTLLHDLIVTIGVYALVGWEVTPATIIGLLTILGYSLYDTVVVFDKIRENTADLFEQQEHSYAELSNLAVNQTLVRSINTSLTSLLPVGAILFLGSVLLGAGTLRDIALALFAGMAVSTLSSVFLATPLQVWLRLRNERYREHAIEVAEHAGGATHAPAESHDETLVPGGHRGHAAQPRRKKKGRR